MDCLNGSCNVAVLGQWLRSCFPLQVGPSGVRRPVRQNLLERRSRKVLRRMEYARVQRLWRLDRKRAVNEILAGGSRRGAHSLDELLPFWAPLLETPAVAVAGRLRCHVNPRISVGAWAPISVEEVQESEISLSSASGPDGISSRQWRAVPSVIRALFFNLILLLRMAPDEMLESRTVFIPKVDLPQSPAEYRPISVTSVATRQLHKVLASRLSSMDLGDMRQRGFTKVDGVAENVIILDAVLAAARSSLRELHVVSLDVRKAFDSVSHASLRSVLVARGLPAQLIEYLVYVYANSTTRFQSKGEFSRPVSLRRGVRQGDPLSPLLFNFMVDEVLAAVPEGVGFHLDGRRISCLAFADDVVVFSSSRAGMTAHWMRWLRLLLAWDCLYLLAKVVPSVSCQMVKARGLRFLRSSSFVLVGFLCGSCRWWRSSATWGLPLRPGELCLLSGKFGRTL